MKTPPDIDEDFVAQALSNTYGLVDPQLSFVPVGEEAWAYQISCADGSRYHFKIYRKSLNWNAVFGIPYELQHKHEFANAVSPIRAINGDLRITVDSYTSALFPWVDGPTVRDHPLDTSQLLEVGRLLAELHSKASALDIPCDRERFDVSSSQSVYMRIIEELPLAKDSQNPFRRELSGLLVPMKDRLLKE